MRKVFGSNDSSSKKKSFWPRRFRRGLFFPAILFGALQIGVSAQPPVNFATPLKKCWERPSKNGASHIIASDNENVILSIEPTVLVSINSKTQTENWRTELGGKIEESFTSDPNSIYFVTALTDQTKNLTANQTADQANQGKFFLNSISIKTGLINWRRETTRNTEVSLPADPEKLLMYGKNSPELSSIQRNTGELLWSKQFKQPIIYLDPLPGDSLILLTEESLFKISVKTGETIQEVAIAQKNARNSASNENAAYLGSENGTVLKINQRTNMIVWKVKTGGSISNVINTGRGILATSFDNFVYLFSSGNGKVIWKKRLGGRIVIKPVVLGDYAIVLNSGDSVAAIIELEKGKTINRLAVGENNTFSGVPVLVRDILLFQALSGIYAFSAVGC